MMVESRNSRKEVDNMEGTATISLDTLDELRAKAEGTEADSGGTEGVVIPSVNVDIVDKSSDTEKKEDK